MLEIIIIAVIVVFIVTYRASSGSGVYKFINEEAKKIYDKYAPYSYKEMRTKIKSMGLDYSPRQYLTQIVFLGGFAAAVGYLYFYSLVVAIVYAIIAIAFVPYLTYLRSKRQYSEFIFEQIQTYVTNTIMEFATTQAFVKSLEGVVESGILEDPVLSDVKTMIALSYEKGDVNDSINYMNTKYPFFMVKNMHQLFLQVTKEGAKDTGETFENMLSDIDVLVEGVYRDRMDRSAFHRQFVMFGFALYGMVILIQLLVQIDTYIILLGKWYMLVALHGVVFINTFFLLKGEKYYNENVGAE
jgi:Ca2+/Na+ antiporter